MQAFANENHTIHHGDALAVLSSQNIPDSSVDLIFVDPPYNIGKDFKGIKDSWPSDEAYCAWVEEWISLCIRKLKPNGSMYLMCSTQCYAPIDMILRKKISVLTRIVWHYDSSGVQAKKYYGSLWEPIFHCVKDLDRYTFNAEEIMVEAKTGAQRKLIDYRKAVPTPYNTKKVPGNAWYFPRVRYRMPEYEDHPSQKPEALLERIILASSNKGDVVLDPFSGTFTTGAVASKLGRKSISIEMNEEFIKVGLRRLNIAKEYQGLALEAPKKNYSSSPQEPIGQESLTLF